MYPTAICITDLVPYVSEGGGYDADAFGIEELDEAEMPEPEDEDEGDDEFADDIPF